MNIFGGDTILPTTDAHSGAGSGLPSSGDPHPPGDRVSILMLSSASSSPQVEPQHRSMPSQAGVSQVHSSSLVLGVPWDFLCRPAPPPRADLHLHVDMPVPTWAPEHGQGRPSERWQTGAGPCCPASRAMQRVPWNMPAFGTWVCPRKSCSRSPNAGGLARAGQVGSGPIAERGCTCLGPLTVWGGFSSCSCSRGLGVKAGEWDVSWCFTQNVDEPCAPPQARGQ